MVKKTKIVKKVVKKTKSKTDLTEGSKSATTTTSKSTLSSTLKRGKLFSAVRQVMKVQTFAGPQKQIIFAMLESEAEVQARLEAEALYDSKLSLRGILWACVTGNMLISSVKNFAKKKRVKRTAKFIEIYSNNRQVT